MKIKYTIETESGIKNIIQIIDKISITSNGMTVYPIDQAPVLIYMKNLILAEIAPKGDL